MTATLRVERVSKAFGSVQAVDGVSLEVRTGEVFGLLGPNGAGKTTLIRMILDIYRPDSGSIEIFGQALTRQDLDQIGYLPEERGLYRRRKVIQILSYLGQLKGLHKAEAVESAERWQTASVAIYLSPAPRGLHSGRAAGQLLSLFT